MHAMIPPRTHLLHKLLRSAWSIGGPSESSPRPSPRWLSGAWSLS